MFSRFLSSFRPTSTRVHSTVHPPLFEPLEGRQLLSVTWVNRNNGDQFDVRYGSNAAVARTIVDRAISDWNTVITNFNQSGGGNSFALTVSAGLLDAGGRGLTRITTINSNGLPTSAAVTLDDNGGGANWYFDQTSSDDAEFGNFISAYTASGSMNTADFYRTITHEIGHAVGIARGAVINGADVFTRLGSALVDTGRDDPNTLGRKTSTGQPIPPASLYTYNVNGGAIEATFTDDGGAHFYEGPSVTGLTVHPNDLMNAGRSVDDGTRQLITDLDATTLQQAYGYTVRMPSTINSFFSNLNDQTKKVAVTATSAGNNVMVSVSSSGRYYVKVDGYEESYPATKVNSFDISTGNGNDLVTLTDDVTKPARIDGGKDNDTLNAGLGNDTIIGGYGDDLMNGNEGDDLFIATGDGDGNDQIYGDSRKDVQITNPLGRDTVDYSAKSTGMTLKLFDLVNLSTGNARFGTEHDFIDAEVVIGTAGADTFDAVTNSSGPLQTTDRRNYVRAVEFRGGAGNDTFYMRNSRADIVDGGSGTDQASLDSNDVRQSIETLL